MVSGSPTTSRCARQPPLRGQLDLSAQRALTVTRTLIDAGVPSSSLFAAAFGSEQPVASNADAEGQARTAAWKSRRCRAWPATRPRNRMSDRAQADAGRERDPIPTAQESDQDRQAFERPVDESASAHAARPPAPPRCRAAPPTCAWTPGASAAPTAWIPCASVSWKRWNCRPYAGAARALLDQRLAALLDAYAADLEQDEAAPAAPRPSRRKRLATRRGIAPPIRPSTLPCPPTPWPAWPARSTPATPCLARRLRSCRCWTCTVTSGPRSAPTASCANRNSRCPTMPARSIPTTWSTARWR